uniref:Uncharacterized protein n=1 Tax=Avena sativa TaxID=4498 RepID=A0ACD5WAY0_AVESA
MAAGASSGRLLRATTARAFHPDSGRIPSSSSPSASGHHATGRPCRIPSLKFPFLWEETKAKHNKSRAAEQRAALITLGPSTAGTLEEKRRGLRLPGEANSVELLLPLAYEVARRLVLRQFGATWLALTRRCWAKVLEAVIHQVNPAGCLAHILHIRTDLVAAVQVKVNAHFIWTCNLIHQGVIRCQSFTLIGVAGSLLGSVPCFLEGCGVVVESFLLQFRAMSQVVDQAEIIKLLIEALGTPSIQHQSTLLTWEQTHY